MNIFDSTFTATMLSNPSMLAKAMIDAMEASDIGKDYSINDPNNGFMIQTAANLSLYSKMSQKVDNFSRVIYPQRATNAEQLYPHLSEFDYVKLMASPATLAFVFRMSKDWIVANAIYYDTNYDKLLIPATSFATIAGVSYSMYYPIEILVNRNTGALSAFYDTTTSNPLNTLASNMLLDVQTYVQNGVNWFQISFNMYQFSRVTTNYTVAAEQGFIETLPYSDQFYAVRVFASTPGGTEIELQYSLTQMYYDWQTPTVLVSLLSDTSQIKLVIPQIFFDNNQISQNIRVELYSTKGKVKYSLSYADMRSIKTNFDTSSSPFAAPLTQMPIYNFMPSTQDIVGGSDAMTYKEIRAAVVNQGLYDGVAVTTPQIMQSGITAGFSLTRLVDDLTDRIYSATNLLVDPVSGLTLPTFSGNILLKDDSLEGNPSSIIQHSDGYYTIQPTTTYRIPNRGLTCIPMTDNEVSVMGSLTPTDLVNELNTGTYVRQPFHVTLLTSAKSPSAVVYNLLSPTMTSLAFVRENAHSAPQMSVTSCQVLHLNNGTGGYRVLLGVARSTNIEDDPATNFAVYLSCSTSRQSYTYLPASYVSTSDLGIDTWQVDLETSYHLNNDDYLSVELRTVQDALILEDIPLNHDFTVITAFKKSAYPTVPADVILNGALPPSAQSSMIAMAQQTMGLSLGTNLSAQIYSSVNTTWGNDVYQTADSTIYFDTSSPIFQLTETGVINTRVDPTTHAVSVVTLYNIGDTPSSTADIVAIVQAPVAIVGPNANNAHYTVDDATGILKGMFARGTNVPVGTQVLSVVGNVVTLSGRNIAIVTTGTVVTFTNFSGTMRTTAAQSAPGKQVTVADTSQLLVGQSVFGFDIPAGTTIATVVDSTHFTLSASSTAALGNNALLTIINTTAKGLVKVAQGSIVTDPVGKPIIVKDAQNQYLIPAILFDGRLYASQDPNDQAMVAAIPQLLQTYAGQISNLDAGLLEDGTVFYKPSRTMGLANFGIGGGKTITMPLELSFTVTVYVDVSVYNTQTLLDTMEAAVLSTCNAAIALPIISISDIAENIKTSLGNNAAAVEMGFISGVDGLKLVSLEDTDLLPSLENNLVINSDGTISRKPNVQITFVPKPS